MSQDCNPKQDLTLNADGDDGTFAPDAGNPDPALTPHTVYTRNYRSSKYFLEDQLRQSAAIQDFQSMKDFLSNAHQFQCYGTPTLAAETIPIYVKRPPQR